MDGKYGGMGRVKPSPYPQFPPSSGDSQGTEKILFDQQRGLWDNAGIPKAWMGTSRSADAASEPGDGASRASQADRKSSRSRKLKSVGK